METADGSLEFNKQGLLRDCASRTTHVSHLPYFYHVHLNMPCNQRCIMCVPDGKHARDVLPFDGFLKLFEQIRPYAEHITLIGGEPLMYPWIDEVLDLLARWPIAVTINTNATLLTGRIANRLLALHRLELRCSVDAATPGTYLRIRGTDGFDRIIANIRDFSARVSDRTRSRVMITYVVMRENLDEVLPFVDVAASLRLYRLDFHPVRHVAKWHVTNGTGWEFDGREQSCEYFRDEYNDVMKRAAEACRQRGLRHGIQLV
jgi:MoaA/NifB/PqqE/SkfB family radical SAM enzyme